MRVLGTESSLLSASKIRGSSSLHESTHLGRPGEQVSRSRTQAVFVGRTCEARIFGAYRQVMKTQTRTSGADAATLGLGSVLVGSLPAALMTDEAPNRYTVEAVFTRRPDRDEVTQIFGGETRDFLKRAGYPTVQVTVSDRRLEIANTNLEELRDGLAGMLAERLAEISEGVRAGRDAAAVRFQDAIASEQVRATAVAELAESVSFQRPGDDLARPKSVVDRTDVEASYRAQIEEWADDGGHGRARS